MGNRLLRLTCQYLLIWILLFCVPLSVLAAHARIISSAVAIDSAATAFWAGIELTLNTGEKIQSGEGGGIAPTIKLRGSENVKALSIRWPVPKKVTLYGMETAVYDTSLVIPFQVHVGASGKPVRLQGTLTYIVCGQTCEPVEKPFLLHIPVGTFKPSTNQGKILQSLEKVADASSASLFQIVFLAMIGGLILNLMPCVLPVLGLKFMSVMASQNMKRPRAGFFMTILGIFTSFLGLAGAAILLKSIGVNVGWGMHFQQPVFLVIMILIMIFFAFSLFGFFEVKLPQAISRAIDRLLPVGRRQGLLGGYFSGVFATLLATPCTAPFLGVAVGFALAQSYGDMVIIFSAIACGFSLPYWLLIALPLRWIPHPKPGAWMVWVKYFLGTCLFATAAWLAVVLYAHVNNHTSVSSPESSSKNRTPWQSFKPEAIQDLVGDGKIVVVNVTAKWCLTCHVNASFLQNTKEVQTLFSHNRLHLMQADWTRHDDEITQFLNAYGRSGIPFTVVFGPSEPGGIVLPELLTKRSLMESLKQAGFIDSAA